MWTWQAAYKHMIQGERNEVLAGGSHKRLTRNSQKQLTKPHIESEQEEVAEAQAKANATGQPQKVFSKELNYHIVVRPIKMRMRVSLKTLLLFQMKCKIFFFYLFQSETEDSLSQSILAMNKPSSSNVTPSVENPPKLVEYDVDSKSSVSSKLIMDIEEDDDDDDEDFLVATQFPPDKGSQRRSQRIHKK